MHILVMHRVPDSFVRYAENIDHEAHQVTYVSATDRLATLPSGVPARLLERPGTGDAAAEVLAAVAGLPRPDLLIALSEYDLLPAARVREALGTPGPTEREVLPVRDKVVMKSVVAAAGLRVPRFAPLPEPLAEGAPALPWSGRTIVKPLAAASSEGVAEYPTVAAALQAVRGGALSSDPEGFEIEEFVEGPIFHVDGLLSASELVAVTMSRYVGSSLGYAEGWSSLGSVQTDTDPEVVAWTLRCLRALGITEGPFHLEGIKTPQGPVFMEVGARFGGGDIVDTFELATGIRLPSAQVAQLVGGLAQQPRPRVPGPDERYGWFVVPGHTLGSRYCRISGEKQFRDDPVVRRWVQRAADEPITDMITYADSVVPLAGVVGPAPTHVLERFFTEMFASVTVEPGCGPG